MHDLTVPPALPSAAEQAACDAAAQSVAAYLRRLGFAESSRTLQTVPADIARIAANSLSHLKRADAGKVRAAAINLVVRDLDHWLTELAEEPGFASAPLAARVASRLETQSIRAVPSEQSRAMRKQRFRSRPSILVRKAWRSMVAVVSGLSVRSSDSRRPA